MASAAALGGRAGLIAGPLAAGAMLALGPPAGLSGAAWLTLALLALMVIWWVSEALPVAATALLPLCVLPSFGVVSARDAAAPYADPIVFLFIGGFMLAGAVEKWGLHKRLALGVAGALGDRPIALVGGFLLSAGLLSMWISNTATALILAPIALGVAQVVSGGRDLDRVCGAGLVLAVAYGASIGGIGTPIGSPTNLVAMSYLERNGLSLTFTQWMALATPLMIVMLLAAFAILGLYVALRGAPAAAGGGGVIRAAYRALGPMTAPEMRVLGVFALVALLWMTRELYSALPGLGAINDTAIALAGAVVLFLLPSGDQERPSAPLLDWATAERIPWGIALLFGAGLSMADAMEATGVTQWLAQNLTWLDGYAPLVVIAAIVVLTVFVSELASNVATLSAFLPIVGGIAAATGIDPLLLVFPACMGASLAFMLPIGTPPNAIAYATGLPSMRLMISLGLALNVIGVVAISAISAALGPMILAP
ncbi:MAG: DASS family sodium-coupled anion symporter [Hyphomonadaceae bacterium]|nr:DASS family sodium-coupled anion symporter [Hyphomonadaceae bacterium]